MTVEIFWSLRTRMWSSLWGCLRLEVVSLLRSEGGFCSCRWRQRCLEGRQLNRGVFCWLLFPPSPQRYKKPITLWISDQIKMIFESKGEIGRVFTSATVCLFSLKSISSVDVLSDII